MTTDNLPAIPTEGALPAKIEYAKWLAPSALLPKQFQGNPANLLYAMEYAEMLGLPPMVAITGIHVIEGKPSASGPLISSLVRKAGHQLRVTGTDKEATCEIVRGDDPEHTTRVTWTFEQARLAGLTNKDVWKKYPRAMLKWRAVTEAARDACPEALFGILYTPEELGAETNADGSVVITSARPALRRVQPRTIAEAVAAQQPTPVVVEQISDAAETDERDDAAWSAGETA